MTLAVWLLSAFFSLLPPAPGPGYGGFWLTEGKDAVIEISRQGDRYVGRYVAFRKDPGSAEKKARLNTYSFQDMKPDGDELNGKIIDPKSGKTYKTVLQLTSPQTIEMRVKALGITAHTETWTRQPTGR